jgi:hypothetical protein
MKYYEASIGTIVIRFFILMAIVILAGFIGQWWIALFALPILLSAMAGVSFKSDKVKSAKKGMIGFDRKNEAA